MTLHVGTSGGNKTATEITVGTSGGNKVVTQAWVGTSGGNELFYTAMEVTVTVGFWVPDGDAYLAECSVSIDGGTGPYTYAWTAGGGLSFVDNTSNPAMLIGDEPFSGVTVSCLVTDANGATATDDAVTL